MRTYEIWQSKNGQESTLVEEGLPGYNKLVLDLNGDQQTKVKVIKSNSISYVRSIFNKLTVGSKRTVHVGGDMIYMVIELDPKKSWVPLLVTTDKSIATDHANALFSEGRQISIWESYDHCKPKLLQPKDWLLRATDN
jgi:hypothetical protein